MAASQFSYQTSMSEDSIPERLRRLFLPEPPRGLLPAIEEAAIWVGQFAPQSPLSPTRGDARRRLLETAAILEARAAALGDSLDRVDVLRGDADDNSSNTNVKTLLQMIRARCVGLGGRFLTAAEMRAFAQGIRAFAARLPKGPGSARVSDALAWPRGRLLCAIAGTELFSAVEGRRPGHSNPRAHELCALIWELTGEPAMPGQRGDENNDFAWDRHLRRALGDSALLLEGRILISRIIDRTGLVRKAAPRAG